MLNQLKSIMRTLDSLSQKRAIDQAPTAEKIRASERALARILDSQSQKLSINQASIAAKIRASERSLTRAYDSQPQKQATNQASEIAKLRADERALVRAFERARLRACNRAVARSVVRGISQAVAMANYLALEKSHKTLSVLGLNVAYLHSLRRTEQPIKLDWLQKSFFYGYSKIFKNLVSQSTNPPFLKRKETSRSTSRSPKFLSTPKPYPNDGDLICKKIISFN